MVNKQMKIKKPEYYVSIVAHLFLFAGLITILTKTAHINYRQSHMSEFGTTAIMIGVLFVFGAIILLCVCIYYANIYFKNSNHNQDTIIILCKWYLIETFLVSVIAVLFFKIGGVEGKVASCIVLLFAIVLHVRKYDWYKKL